MHSKARRDADLFKFARARNQSAQGAVIEREREGLFVSLFAVVAAFSSKQPRGHEHEMKCVADGPGNTCPPFCAPSSNLPVGHQVPFRSQREYDFRLPGTDCLGVVLADGQACSKGNHVRGLWAPFASSASETRIAQPRET